MVSKFAERVMGAVLFSNLDFLPLAASRLRARGFAVGRFDNDVHSGSRATDWRSALDSFCNLALAVRRRFARNRCLAV